MNSTGAHDRDRTGDLVLTKDVLYQLSYVGRRLRELGYVALERVMGIEPTSSAWKAEVLPLNYTRLTDVHPNPPPHTASLPASDPLPWWRG